MSDKKIENLQSKLNSYKSELTKYAAYFNASDGIDQVEMEQIQSMQAIINKAEVKLQAMKKEAALPKDFRKVIKEIKAGIDKVKKGLEQSIAQEKVNEKSFEKFFTTLERAIMSARGTYSSAEEPVFNQCDAMLTKYQKMIAQLKRDVKGAALTIDSKNKKEVQLDSNMKKLLNKHGSPSQLYDFLVKKLVEVESKFNTFIEENSQLIQSK